MSNDNSENIVHVLALTLLGVIGAYAIVVGLGLPRSFARFPFGLASFAAVLAVLARAVRLRRSGARILMLGGPSLSVGVSGNLAILIYSLAVGLFSCFEALCGEFLIGATGLAASLVSSAFSVFSVLVADRTSSPG